MYDSPNLSEMDNPFQFHDSHIVIPKGTPTTASLVGAGANAAGADAAAVPMSPERLSPYAAVSVPAETDRNFARVLADLDSLVSLYVHDGAGELKAAPDSKTPAYMRGRDSLKIIHMMATTSTKKEKDAEAKLLSLHIDAVLTQVTRCVECAFTGVVASAAGGTQPAANAPNAIDINLLALSLAVLFAVLQQKQVVWHASVGPVQAMLGQVVLRLLDPQLAQKGGAYSANAEKLIGAMNMVVLQAVDSLDRSTALAAGMGLMHPAAAAAVEADPELARKINKLNVRLFKKMLKKELRAAAAASAAAKPFTTLRLSLVLGAAHAFFAACTDSASCGAGGAVCPAPEGDESPLKAVNTLISELVQALKGQPGVLRAAMRTVEAKAGSGSGGTSGRAGTPTELDAVVTQHEGKHGILPCHAEGEGARSSSSSDDVEVQSELTRIFQRISAHGKLNSPSSSASSQSQSQFQLGELHAFKQKYPGIDVLSQMPPCSAAFKEFVRQGLQKMMDDDCGGGGTAMANVSGSAMAPHSGSAATASGSAAAAACADPSESKENSHPVDAIGERLRNLQARLKMNPIGNNNSNNSSNGSSCALSGSGASTAGGAAGRTSAYAPLAGSSKSNSSNPTKDGLLGLSTASTKANTVVGAKSVSFSDKAESSGKIDIANLKQRLEKLKSGQLIS
jgi:hypothetical protein